MPTQTTTVVVSVEQQRSKVKAGCRPVPVRRREPGAQSSTREPTRGLISSDSGGLSQLSAQALDLGCQDLFGPCKMFFLSQQSCLSQILCRGSSCTPPCTRARTHARTHTHTYGCTHTDAHTLTQTCIHGAREEHDKRGTRDAHLLLMPRPFFRKLDFCRLQLVPARPCYFPSFIVAFVLVAFNTSHEACFQHARAERARLRDSG